MFNKQGRKSPAKLLTIMIKKCKLTPTKLERNCTEKAESIEEMLRRLTANKEPIPQNVPPIYTAEKDGVIPDYDIRADRFKIAGEAADKFAASDIAKSAEKPAELQEPSTEPKTE